MLKILGSLGPTVSHVPPTTNDINYTVCLTSLKSLFPAYLYNVGGGSTGQREYIFALCNTYYSVWYQIWLNCGCGGSRTYMILLPVLSVQHHIGEDYTWLQTEGDATHFSPSFAHSQQVYLLPA